MEKLTEKSKRGLDDNNEPVSKRKNSSTSSTSDSRRSRSRCTDECEPNEGKSEVKEENLDEEISEKKKENFKGKLFQCTGYHGCSMVFTRSEHLARHIRKHTGERPFECGTCKKRFSRLDNLRQHKQTVHLYDFDKNIKVNKKTTKKLRKGNEPVTPSVITEFNTLSSPPNSVSPQLKRVDNKLPPPPPRQPIFLQKHESFSDTRNSYNKPVPLVLENTSNTNDGLRIITPTTGTGSIMETNSPNSRLNQLKMQTRSGSTVSPSMPSFNGINSPGINLVGPMSMGSVPENLSPYGLMFGSNSTTVTPTNASFDFQRQSTYTPSVYYQRNNRSVQYQMNNTPNKALHQLRRESFNQRSTETGEEEENNQNYSNQYITYVPFGQMNMVSPINQYTPVGQPSVSPLLNQMGQLNSIYNPLLGHINQLGPMNQIYNQYSSTPVSYVPYVSQFPQPSSGLNFSQNLSQPPSATSKSFPISTSNTENKTSSIPSLTSTGQSTLSSTDKHDSKYETVQLPPLPQNLATEDPKLQIAGTNVIESGSKEGEVGINKNKTSSESTTSNSSNNGDNSSYGNNCKKRILLESILNG
ncbi:hypothetical protein CANINC_000232 [Pichia inconspicua]|uniref:C2H2-type domain-containing protein n=1 Tax=Pichia inconspicua TaxID=52247 RepID=A0A4T0X727_9ASCO|nr:hypothetical protein CANINC_000232 [[Candida] inconspicua]